MGSLLVAPPLLIRDAMDLVEVIRKSLTVFVCGIFGFLPVIGLLPALYAISCWLRVNKRHGRKWNPARRYLIGGFLLALIGVLSSGLVITVALLAMATN